MSVLRDLAAGRRPHAIAPHCRLEGFGTEAFAIEPIMSLLRSTPRELTGGTLVESAGAAVLLATQGRPCALFADLNDGVLVRLWRLGPPLAEPLPVRPRVDVAVDHDLSQLRPARPFFDPAAHPELHGDLGGAIEAALAFDLATGEPELRRHLFVRRAFTSGDTDVALFGVSILTDAPRRRPLDCNLLVVAGPGAAPRMILDHAGLAAAQQRAWVPRL